MKVQTLASFAAVLALSSCETMHNAAVTTFRVVDAPHQYVRRQLGVDEQGEPQPTTTTTTTETTYYGPPGSPPPPPPPQQTYPVQPQPFQPYANQPGPPPPPVETERRVATRERTSSAPPETGPTATPRVASKERMSKPSPTPRTSSAQTTSDLPYAKPVPGKPGYVYSPFDPNGGYVDVKGYAPGQKVKDPYTGKIFLVP